MLRVVFMGTPDFAVPSLMEIVGQGHEVAAVYTRPPRPAGRGMAERQSAVHEAASRFGLAVETPVTLRDGEVQARLAAHGADVAVVAAYGLLLPRPVLDAPALGCFNVHASLLPRWRGAAPIHRAVMAGDRETGVSIMRMAEGLDTGDVCLVERTPIGPDETTGALHDRLARLGADAIVRALAALSRGGLDCRPQPEDGVTTAAKISKAEARIDWRRPAADLHDHVRGLAPSPGAFFELPLGGGPERVRLLRASVADGSGSPGTVLDAALTVACGGGALRPLLLQRAGRAPMEAAEFLRGTPVPPGTVLPA